MVQPRHDSDNLSHNHKVALDHAAKGINVFPCRWDEGPPGKDGKPQWRPKSPMPRVMWTTEATTNPEIINAWWEAAPQALVGMPLAPLDIAVLDPDQHPGGADGVAAYDKLAERYPSLKQAPYVQTPHGRHHIFQQTTPPLGNSVGKPRPGIDVRGVGGYVIAPGTKLPDGSQWVLMNGGAPPQQLPLAVIDMIRGKEPDPEPDPEFFRQAFDLDAITYPDGRRKAYMRKCVENAWNKLSQAKKGERNATLFYEGRRLAHLVYGGFLIKHEIVAMLHEACVINGLDSEGGVDASIASAFDPAKAEPRDPIGDDDDDLIKEFGDWDGTETQASADRIYKGSELGSIQRQHFLIDGLIPEGTLGLMVGESQTFKSFIAGSMCATIAAGLPHWNGHAIKAPDNAITLYIAGEGGIASAAKRLEAWAIDNGVEIADLDRFRVITWPINLLDKASRTRLVNACKAQIDGPLALIVVDTVNTSIPGADENSSKDMGSLYAIMRHLSLFFSCAIMGVHHTNRQGKTRGSGVLTQNADFTLHAKRADMKTMNVELHVTKLKDDPTGAQETYHLDLIALADGSTSLVPKHIGAIQAEKTETTASGRPSSRADAILTVLRNSRRIDGETPTEICNILDITEGWEKRAVAKALRRLETQNVVTRDGNKWSIIDAGGGFFDD